MNIPTDFDSAWALSDVILLVVDAEGNEKELHANRAFLAPYSSFFERMFFSKFKEANSESVKVSCSYESLKLILQIIYGLCRGETVWDQTYEVPVLMELYKAGDYLDISLIRTLCTKQMLDRPTVEMATAVLRVTKKLPSLHGTLMDIMKKMSSDKFFNFLSVDDSSLVFTKIDMEVIYEFLTKKPLPAYKTEHKNFNTWNYNGRYYDLTTLCESPLIISTETFPGCDVSILTNNSEGERLFSNKMVLTMVSPHFAEMFSHRLASQDSLDSAEIELDVEYSVMKNILCIIHHCYDGGHLDCSDWEPLSMSYMMYCAASEENLNIPRIRKMFKKGFEKAVERVASDIHFDIAVKFHLTSAKSKILKNISKDDLVSWFYVVGMRSERKYFIDDDSYVIPYVYMDEHIFSLKDVYGVILKLLK